MTEPVTEERSHFVWARGYGRFDEFTLWCTPGEAKVKEWEQREQKKYDDLYRRHGYRPDLDIVRSLALVGNVVTVSFPEQDGLHEIHVTCPNCGRDTVHQVQVLSGWRRIDDEAGVWLLLGYVFGVMLLCTGQWPLGIVLLVGTAVAHTVAVLWANRSLKEHIGRVRNIWDGGGYSEGKGLHRLSKRDDC